MAMLAVKTFRMCLQQPKAHTRQRSRENCRACITVAETLNCVLFFCVCVCVCVCVCARVCLRDFDKVQLNAIFCKCAGPIGQAKRVYGRSLARIVSSNNAVGINVPLVRERERERESERECVFCPVELPASGRSLVQRSHTDSGCVLECD
jgi:hypothetical protein